MCVILRKSNSESFGDKQYSNTMVERVPILFFSKIYFRLLTQSIHHNRRPQSNRKWFFTIQWPPEKVEVEYFAGLDGKILDITIKTAIFMLKFLHEEGLGVDEPINEKNPFLPKWLIELNLTLPNLALKWQYRKIYSRFFMFWWYSIWFVHRSYIHQLLCSLH